MKNFVKENYALSSREVKRPLDAYIVGQLESTELGAVESLEDTMWNFLFAFGNLVDVLTSKGVLDAEDIADIIGEDAVQLVREDE